MCHPARPIAVLAVALLAGCQPSPNAASANPAPPTAASPAFDPARCGTITGRVKWVGDAPAVPALEAVGSSGAVPNPHTPRFDAATRGVAGAVVFVRSLDPAAGRPWDLPPVRVDQSPEGIRVVQGKGPPRAVGFVQRGAEVSMRSTAAGPLSLRARGAAFFTLAFPDPDRPLARRFDAPGIVELTSGSGQFWASADLFVTDHPYYTLTGPDGSFTLTQVPAGDHEVVAWVRNWHVTGKDRDPETGLVVRLRYANPVEKPTTVRVEAGRTAEAAIPLSAADFTSR